jgi:hypothetical protein
MEDMSDNDYVRKTDLQLALDATKRDLQFALDGAVRTIITEMGIRFGEVNQRLDRMDATFVNHGKQLAAGAWAIAGLNEWVGKADADYTRVLSELSELKLRVAKLERPEKR